MLIAAQPGQHIAATFNAERNRLDQPFHWEPEGFVGILDRDRRCMFVDRVGGVAGVQQRHDAGKSIVRWSVETNILRHRCARRSLPVKPTAAAF